MVTFDKAAKAVWMREYMREYRKGLRRRNKAKASSGAKKEGK